MRFLADENFPLASVTFLRNCGYDVMLIGGDHSGLSDVEIIETATRENRTVLTFDKDFGEMVFKHDHRPAQGIIFFRLSEFKPAEPGELLHTILQNNDFKPENALTVIDKGAVRQKRY